MNDLWGTGMALANAGFGNLPPSLYTHTIYRKALVTIKLLEDRT